MQRFRLQAPMKATLLNVLDAYPGGQLLSEALQKAEDSDASQFSLLLDLRRHDSADPAFSGPDFVLTDNGAGFGEREWRSLQNLHSSEKRNTPRGIGRYGMGSRSYFHYADVTIVVSRGQYVGVDPLEVVSSQGRANGGWQLNLAEPGDHALIAAEAAELAAIPECVAGGYDAHARGALFRLPLRTAADVQREEATELGPLGPEMSVVKTEALPVDWEAAASRLLLFLSSVRNLGVWRWAEGAPAPERVAPVNQEYLAGGPCARLPPSLPTVATESYKAFRAHVLGLGEAQRVALSEVPVPRPSNINLSARGGPALAYAHAHRRRRAQSSSACRTTHLSLTSHVTGERAVVRLSLDGAADGTGWLVAQRFDAATPELRQAMSDGCEGVPAVGVALPLTHDEPLAGAPFCFLPIGGQASGLPVHINAAFAVASNRRDLWWPCKDLDGAHARMAQWNDSLCRHALPRLWVEALRILGPQVESLRRAGLVAPEEAEPHDAGARRVLARLPEVERIAAPWQP